MSWRARAGRVGQRAEEVEDRAHGELLAHRHDEARRLVVRGREHEAEAGLVDAARRRRRARGRCARRAPRGRRRSPTGRSPSGCRAWPARSRRPAAISAAVVETLKVGRPPPVPAVSSRSSRSHCTGVASARIVPASPASSSTVSPFVRSAMRNAAICISEALPAMISASTAAASSAPGPGPTRARRWPGSGRVVAALKEVLQQQLAVVGEHGLGVELDALGGQLAVADGHDDAAAAAETSKQSGTLSSSTTSEW